MMMMMSGSSMHKAEHGEPFCVPPVPQIIDCAVLEESKAQLIRHPSEYKDRTLVITSNQSTVFSLYEIISCYNTKTTKFHLRNESVCCDSDLLQDIHFVLACDLTRLYLSRTVLGLMLMNLMVEQFSCFLASVSLLSLLCQVVAAALHHFWFNYFTWIGAMSLSWDNYHYMSDGLLSG